MTRFDCSEYWLHTTWDRTRELNRLSGAIRDELIRQEQFLVLSLSKAIGTRMGVSIADIGSGPGHIAKTVIGAFGDCISLHLVDINAGTLAEARRRVGNNPNTHFHLGDLGDVGRDFPGAFDVVYCLDILHHLANLPLVLQSVCASLTPGGVLLANAFADDSYGQWDRLKYGLLRSFARRVSAALANGAYPWLGASGQNWIRKHGWGRIAPMSEEELRIAFAPEFNVDVHRVGYYYFVHARASKDAQQRHRGDVQQAASPPVVRPSCRTFFPTSNG